MSHLIPVCDGARGDPGRTARDICMGYGAGSTAWGAGDRSRARSSPAGAAGRRGLASPRWTGRNGPVAVPELAPSGSSRSHGPAITRLTFRGARDTAVHHTAG